MANPFGEIDQILRGEKTRPSALANARIDIAVGPLIPALVGLGMVYGACMGLYAVINHDEPKYLQIVSTMLKVPALFFLTLLVTFPSLYVFNALVGSRLSLFATLQLLTTSFAVTLSVLASLGPIVAFFSISTESYSFMVLLNVAIFAASGVLGLTFLLFTLYRLSLMGTPASGEATADDAEPPPGALDRLHGQVLGPHIVSVFRIWVVLFGLVGAQMAWVLRPFVGDPASPFQWFRPRQASFLEAILSTITSLMG